MISVMVLVWVRVRVRVRVGFGLGLRLRLRLWLGLGLLRRPHAKRSRLHVPIDSQHRARVAWGGHFLTSHTIYSIFYRRVGHIQEYAIFRNMPYSGTHQVNHKIGRMLNRNCPSSDSPDFVTVHGKAAVSGFRRIWNHVH